MAKMGQKVMSVHNPNIVLGKMILRCLFFLETIGISIFFLLVVNDSTQNIPLTVIILLGAFIFKWQQKRALKKWLKELDGAK